MNGPAGAAIKLVCFDLGGVVVRICRSWQEGCEAAGLPVRDGMQTPEMKARRRALTERYHAGELECEVYFERLAETTGGLYAPDEVRRIHEAWTLGVYDGIEDLIANLEASGRVELGVLSNTNHAHWRVMSGPTAAEQYGVLRRIRHLHASHLLGLVKPSPEIYRAFERETGMPGRRILFFDDLEENVRGAREAGWHAEQIDHTGDTPRQIRSHLSRYGVL